MAVLGRIDPRAVRWVRVRLALVAAGFVALFAAVTGRAVQLQVLDRERLASMARDQYMRLISLAPRRGEIRDSGGALAVSVDADSIYADPGAFPPEAVGPLAAVLRLGKKELKERLSRGRHFAWVKRKVAPPDVQKVKALALPGVGFLKEERRHYPQRELAGHVLGFTGLDGPGLEGLERALDRSLRGREALIPGLRDAKGGEVYAEKSVDVAEVTGATVTLTLDRGVQHITEKALGRAVKETGAAAGVAVVLDPRSARVLAMAVRPGFNPNAPGDDPSAWRNRAVQDTYEPGSTVKVFTIAAALETRAVRAADIFHAEQSFEIGGHVIHDSMPHGWLTPAKVLKVSSNIGAAQIAQRMGKEGLVAALRSFGFGERTEIGLPGEGRGVLRDPLRMPEITLATTSFGQGMTATPIQLATALCAVANGGLLLRPWIVERVEAPDGELLAQGGPQLVRRALSSVVARQVAGMMEGVVNGGTGARAAIDGYRVAGKTGTAQKVDALTGGYSVDKRLASFMGFAPVEDARIAVYVALDEPKGEVMGGVIAAPLFREIVEEALRYLAVPPSLPLAAAAAEGPPPAPLPSPPDDGYVDSAGAEVVVGAGSDVVPDLLGMGARAAVRTLSRRDFDPAITGTGTVVSQTPRPGAVAARGTQVQLVLAPRGGR